MQLNQTSYELLSYILVQRGFKAQCVNLLYYDDVLIIDCF